MTLPVTTTRTTVEYDDEGRMVRVVVVTVEQAKEQGVAEELREMARWASTSALDIRDVCERLIARAEVLAGGSELLAEAHLRGLAGDAEHVADLLPGGTVRTGLGNDVTQSVLGLGDDVATEPQTLAGGLAAVGEVVGKSDEGCGVVDVHVVKDDLTMSACQARLDGGVGMRRVPDKCNGMCVMGNEVMPDGGYYDWAAYPHPDCPRHGDAS